MSKELSASQLQENILFSDECWITTKENTGRYQWVRNNELPFPREVQGRYNVARLMVWACVGVGYRSRLVFIPKMVKNEDGEEVPYNLNAEGYQDGARPHIAASTIEYFAANRLNLLQNPPYSPDLNPIENVWADLE